MNINNDMTLDTLILLALCGVLGWQLHNFYMTYRMLRIMKRFTDLRDIHDDADTETIEADHLMLEVIQEQGIFLVYDEDNNFICQGKDLTEAAVKFKERTNNSMGEFTWHDKSNCFYNGEHLDHTQYKKHTVKA